MGAYFDALGQGVADGEFGHVVLFFSEADEVIIDPGLIFTRVIEVEVFRLHVVFGEFFVFEFGNIFEKTLFLQQCHSPYDDGAVLKQKYLRGVDLGVEVQGVFPLRLRLFHLGHGMIWY